MEETINAVRQEFERLIRQLQDCVVENEKLREQLRSIGANRYWENRWRDADAEIKRLKEMSTK